MAFHDMKTADVDRLKAILAKAEEDHEWLDKLTNDWRSALDDKSEKYKEGENGEACDTAITNLENVRDALDSLKDALNEVEGIND